MGSQWFGTCEFLFCHLETVVWEDSRQECGGGRYIHSFSSSSIGISLHITHCPPRTPPHVEVDRMLVSNYRGRRQGL